MKIRGFVRLLGVGFLKNEENLNLTVSCETPAFKKRGMFQLFHAVKNATEEKYSDPVPMANGKKSVFTLSTNIVVPTFAAFTPSRWKPRIRLSF